MSLPWPMQRGARDIGAVASGHFKTAARVILVTRSVSEARGNECPSSLTLRVSMVLKCPLGFRGGVRVGYDKGQSEAGSILGSAQVGNVSLHKFEQPTAKSVGGAHAA